MGTTKVVSQGNVLSETSGMFQDVTWRVHDFFNLPLVGGYFLESPRFSFAGGTWFLQMFPNGREKNQTDGDVVISLVRSISSVAEHKLSYVGGIKLRSGGEYKSLKHQGCFSDKMPVYGLRFSKSYIKKSLEECIPYGTMTVHCEIFLTDSSSGGMLKTDLGEISYIIGEDFLKKQEELLSAKKAISDYKKLLQSGEASDVCLVVSGKEFRAHRCILGARSPVFSAMFHHDTEERKSGKVVIDDLDPDCFQHFLEHVYTGRVEAFSEENALGLYTAADKYDVQALKSVCVKYMQRTLSVDSFCEVMTLALRHHEEELEDFAVEFFKKNLAKIIVTLKWQMFSRDYNTQANELLIKALVPWENQK